MSFPIKYVAESLPAGTNWSRLLTDGETIVSAEVTIRAKHVASDPQADVMLVGLPTIQGTIVSQKLAGGVSNVLYITTWRIVTSTPRTLVEPVTLSVE
jgi:hypothetical protein